MAGLRSHLNRHWEHPEVVIREADPKRPARWGATERRRAIGCVMVGAMVAAPFLALLYGIDAGLAVLCLALIATTYATLAAARRADAPARRALRLLAAGNGLLALICLILLAVRLS